MPNPLSPDVKFHPESQHQKIVLQADQFLQSLADELHQSTSLLLQNKERKKIDFRGFTHFSQI